jgi:outer membrane receptor for ferrienterochelin and colicin
LNIQVREEINYKSQNWYKDVTVFENQYLNLINKTPSHSMTGYGGLCLSSQSTQEALIERTVAQGQPVQKTFVRSHFNRKRLGGECLLSQ